MTCIYVLYESSKQYIQFICSWSQIFMYLVLWTNLFFFYCEHIFELLLHIHFILWTIVCFNDIYFCFIRTRNSISNIHVPDLRHIHVCCFMIIFFYCETYILSFMHMYFILSTIVCFYGKYLCFIRELGKVNSIYMLLIRDAFMFLVLWTHFIFYCEHILYILCICIYF